MVTPDPVVDRGGFSILSVHSCTDEFSVNRDRTGQGREINLVVGDETELEVGVVARHAVQHDVRGHDKEQHEEEEDRADAAPQREGAAVIKRILERGRGQLDLRRQVRSE